jgi:hypothetical protein
VSQCDLAIYILKASEGKRRIIYGNSNISPSMQKYNLQKNPLKETKILPR